MSIPISFEVYPPRDSDGAQSLYEAIDNLGKLNPSFISVTFGAGGSDTNGSIEVLNYIREQTSAMPLAHLTCVGTTKAQVQSTLQMVALDQIIPVLPDREQATARLVG
jgi:methylenetetrahydrofolate reductase (NADPH)